MKGFLVAIVLACLVFSTGCFVAPEPPPVETPIVCEGGYYGVHYNEWQSSSANCADDPVYLAGTYWINANGRLFLLGEPVGNAVDTYGDCPTEFIVEFKLE